MIVWGVFERGDSLMAQQDELHSLWSTEEKATRIMTLLNADVKGDWYLVRSLDVDDPETDAAVEELKENQR